MHQWHAACLPFLLSALAWSQCSKKNHCNKRINLAVPVCVCVLIVANKSNDVKKSTRYVCPWSFYGEKGHVGGWQVATSRNNNLEAEICLPDQLPTVCVRAHVGMCERLYLVMLRGRTKIQKTEATVSDRGGRARKERLVIIKGRTHTHTHKAESCFHHFREHCIDWYPGD